MVKAKYERTQPGNPHKLTIDQHIFPAASIARFAGADRGVELYDRNLGSLRRARPRDHIFCTQRRWDQRAEDGYMRSIEDQFQTLAELIICGEVDHISGEQREIVHRFYLLWNMRDYVSQQDPHDEKMNGILGPSRSLTDDNREVLEKKHGMSMRDDGTVASRHLVGVQIQMNIDRHYEQDSDTTWGIARSVVGELLVPDRPVGMMVPISPTIMLLGNNPDGFVHETGLRSFNRLVVAGARRLYFARSIEACPT